VSRKNKPKNRFTQNTYRKALPALLKDFENRCAYSLIHVEDAGKKTMEVDHHNPQIGENKKHNYENLFPATRHCNGSKSNIWPSASMQKKGIHFLNPCKEGDYGFQIFEKENGELIGTTPAAEWHIRILDLNDSHLVKRRKSRAELRKMLADDLMMLSLNADPQDIFQRITFLKKTLAIAIPPIPPPPAATPKN
jgi:hypothetical protein